MKKLSLPLSVVLMLAASNAQAHAHLTMSAPAEGAVVTEMPTSVVLTFSEAARITAVSIQKDQEPKQTLKAPTGAAAEQISVMVPKLAPGKYKLSWRVVSADDNHIMSGELHFRVAPMSVPTTR